MNWTELSWAKDREGNWYAENVFIPENALLICKFNSRAGTYFKEMAYADTEEGFCALQEVVSKYWNIHQQKWVLEVEWEDDYFPVAYTLYPDLFNND
jgi:hypothetical protein